MGKLQSVSSDRNLTRLIASSAASNLADGALQTVLPLVALSITRDPAAFATVALVARLPWLLVALPAGALADRLDRRRTMVLVNLGRVVVLGALTLVVAAGSQELWMLCVVAFVLGVGETLFDTAGQSILPNLVHDPRQLERANSRLYAVELTANQFVGPAVGGVVAGLALAAGVATSTIAYLLGAVALTTIAGTFRARPPESATARRSMRHDIADGLRYLARHQLLRSLALVVGLSNLASSTAFAVFPLYAVAPGPMGLSGAGFGLLMAALAAGSVGGTFLAGPLLRRLGTRRTLAVAMAAGAAMYAVPALTANPWAV
ncbi:MAG TPA: MFS transporter, partial [Ilumatobacteraceae bacterium]|nr:MFS transporter [Ilumatobacteraceae bacterium]